MKDIMDMYVTPMKEEAEMIVDINGTIDEIDLNILVRKYHDMALISFNSGAIDIDKFSMIMFSLGVTTTMISIKNDLM